MVGMYIENFDFMKIFKIVALKLPFKERKKKNQEKD